MSRILVLIPHPAAVPAPDTAAWPLRPSDGLSPVYRPVRCPTSGTGGFFDARLEDLLVFDNGRQAAEEGFDAVCTLTLDDGGAAALRSVLDLPVLATGRTTSLHALTLADRFAWLVETRAQEARLRAALRQWHLAERCVAIRVAPADQPQALHSALADCVDIDGAGAICLGSPALVACALGPAPALGAPDRPAVPLLEPLAVTCRMAEALLASNLTHSRTAAPRPLVPKPAVIQAMADTMATYSHGEVQV